ncbi:MAG TPA: diaminopimelate epimerase [Mycobacteriales bacterium]|nr:diaminopimelate epimerase [Mycobacteriales bacterium]
MDFIKGHGTENDFVLLPDPDDRLTLTPELVRAICDRRAGIGADGVLRVVRSDSAADFFMDYYNADGTTGEMCGNGLRVFARYLVAAGLAEPGEWPVLTRAGLRGVRVGTDGPIRTDMGAPEFLAAAPAVGGRPGVAVSMGNPHVVVQLPDQTELAALDLTRAPEVDGALPDGQNVEFVVRRGPRSIAMRVHERGVGETRSCGTGVCAAAAVAAGVADGEDWTVTVPGGELQVRWDAQTMYLSGPAVLVASGQLDTEALVPAAEASL